MKIKETIHVLSGVEATVMPKYNAYGGGYGLHKSAKHPSRQERKMKTRKEIMEY